MLLFMIGLLGTSLLLGYAIYIKVGYIKKHEAICLDYIVGSSVFITHVLYEYEMIIAKKTVKYKNWGNTVFWVRRGKNYKIFVNKKNYSKVVGYAEYVVCLVFGCFFGMLTIADLIF